MTLPKRLSTKLVRIVKEKKIKEIVAYLSGKSSDSYPSILPSNILIALDNIEYDETTKKLIKYVQDNEAEISSNVQESFIFFTPFIL